MLRKVFGVKVGLMIVKCVLGLFDNFFVIDNLDLEWLFVE